MVSYYVYLYRDPSKNNEPFYVGTRKGCPGQNLTIGQHDLTVQRRIKEIQQKGYTPSFDPIKTDSKEKATALKYQLIKMFGCLDSNTGTLLNSSKHAKIGKQSIETKAFSSTARANMSAAAKKRILTPEGRANLFTPKVKDEYPPQVIADILRTKSQQPA